MVDILELSGHDMVRLAALSRTFARDCGNVAAGGNVNAEGRADPLPHPGSPVFKRELVSSGPVALAIRDECLRRRLLTLPDHESESVVAGWALPPPATCPDERLLTIGGRPMV